MSTPDDLPWPELGNVSRGATRGNQGQKGVLGPPDREGRCVLQLRVQPGVLAVRLNRQASEWYRILDNEVNRALKLTKTYWRKARRRQDYDARADQDHMELHEWLQQLKDKTMSHLELLMQKGDIQGPPYTMPDDIELTFLRKFIERQAAGIPHNPRLRNAMQDGTYPHPDHSAESLTPEPSEGGFMDSRNHYADRVSDDSLQLSIHSRTSVSPSLMSPEALLQEAASSKQALQAARMSLLRAQKDTQDSFMRYTACLDVERQARQAVTTAEKRRDDIMTVLLARSQPQTGDLDFGADSRSRNSSLSGDERGSPSRYHAEFQDNRSAFIDARVQPKSLEQWPEQDATQGIYSTNEVANHIEDPSGRSRKRAWEHPNQLTDGQYACEELASLPPRKRIHHMIANGFDVISTPGLQATNMALHS
ncbi:hypothetical protein AGABI1DRAFT_107605 [Agaricus bisporus var. burnettii JB137-S8]|uniref:Uncharacterized protein n=1 Tax=Agaricus bisporus var. burnettii (strain JB137-S8 / ATCC MYA-4627 / FGSC 10392) TaxID=597362 RepID=K5XTQ2_AGABU|nr:uncharacterized protein AGABI1DRAFT_107605 [Agaricus bisporus var. burnettii JB137-S8]EKM78425.1 hypothetical protein AGABI1DRAFT_107605 [Agaricus bisporus var. burnettii JB137-S8]